MRTIPQTFSLLLLATVGGAGCSVVNSFSEVEASSPEESGGSGGDSGSGGAEMGGASSGGSGTGGTVDGSGGGDGTGGSVAADPGLVVAIETADFPNDILFALSPQDGSELARDTADYDTAAYEPRRGVWFFVRDKKLAAARFDRETNEWDFLTRDGPEITGLTPFTELFFAFNERVALKLGTKLQIFDTSDLADLKFAEEVDYPAGTPWGAAAASKSVGGNVVILNKNCPAGVPLTCPIELTSIAVTRDVVQVGGTVVVDPDFAHGESGSAAGRVRYDIGTEQVVVLVPDPSALGSQVGKIAQATLYTPDSLVVGQSFNFQQPGNQISTLDIDPCHSVVHAMSPISQNLSGFPLDDSVGVIPMFEPVGINGRRVVYEPYTRSLILVEDEAADFGLDAYSLTGTQAVPDVRKRITDWSPPTVRPKFLAVETTETPLCN